MLNIEQQNYVEYISKIPPEQRCYCGWYKLNECPNCKSTKTLEDRINASCPFCHNSPDEMDETKYIIHRVGCEQDFVLY